MTPVNLSRLTQLRIHFLFLLLPGVEAALSKWWEHEYQYCYVEAIILIVLVMVALAFERFWHFLKRSVTHTYRYGKLHDQLSMQEVTNQKKDFHGNLRHPLLFEELVDRAGGEFMTLGLLAFLTFLFNNVGGFKVVARYRDAGIALPTTDVAWLHMVELIHVKLFVGMMLYFFMASSLVRSGCRQMEVWERCRLRRVKQILAEESPNHVVGSARGLDRDYDTYCLWRDYFIEKVWEWKKRRPFLWRKTLEHLSIDIKDPNAHNELCCQVEERFSLAAYLSINVGSAICGSIHIHSPTWIILIILFGIFALLHRYGKIDLQVPTLTFCGCAFLLMLLLRWRIHKDYKRIPGWLSEKRSSKSTLSNEPSLNSSATSTIGNGEAVSASPRLHRQQTLEGRHWLEVFVIEIHFATSMQVVLFLISYVFARTLMDFNEWAEHFQRTLLACCLFTLLFIALHFTITSQVPMFLALLALPPYVNDLNLEHFFETLLDDHQLQQDPESGQVRQRARISSANAEQLLRDPAFQEALDDKVEQITKSRAFSKDFAGHYVPADMGEMWTHITELKDRVRQLESSTRDKDPCAHVQL
eukprot:TRINITY_DN103011_c0_g1_i1.p1 TRINITY_DN103011_c0_g1~~TRINITY_DN103011_c0_g1_i1.p1  ORF type:complete len:585 (-),score=75.51 TRINITY_DN103011_c0_g1_i1:173-1927(-)